MARQAFRDTQFTDASLERIATCNDLFAEYRAHGLRPSVRQMFYRLVARNAIENSRREYKRLSSLLSEARLAGLVDWTDLEDRTRVPHLPPEYKGVDDLIDEALARFRLNRWAGQAAYCELMVEKDALSGVLKPIAEEYHVALVVNRGYSSQTAMYESALRFRAACSGPAPRTPLLFYLGDFDPSGLDMGRDIAARFAMYGVDATVIRLALTKDQVEEHNLPPNPAKMSDTRAQRYVAEHGPRSWEVDALPPDVLARIVRDAFGFVRVQALVDAVLQDEERIRDSIRGVIRPLKSSPTASDDNDDGKGAGVRTDVN